MLVKIFFILFIVQSQQQDPSCTSQWQLSNLIQTTNTLRINSPADTINQLFNYPFGASYFDKKPTSILSIADYDCQSFNDINFSIVPHVNDTVLTIKFQSEGMKWGEVKVIVWLTSRPDMITGLIDTDELNGGSLQNNILTINTSAPVKFYEDSRTWYLNYITGMRAKSEKGIYDVNTSAYSKSENTYSIEIATGADTTLEAIKITYVIFNLQISLFSSGGGYESESDLRAPIYKKVHKNFVPVNYRMLGFDKIKLEKGKRFHLHLGIDLDYILQAESEVGISYIRVVYLTIGQKTSRVCSQCNNFIYRQICVNSCPEFSYPFFGYVNGGKSCLTCSPKVNEEINQRKTGCKCLTGYKRNQTGYCITEETTSGVTDIGTLTPDDIECGENKTAVNGQCVCDKRSILLQNNNCFKCPLGNYKQNQVCIQCIKNCISCENDEQCVQCGNGFEWSEESKSCTPFTAECGLNKTLENGKCVCDNKSILLNNDRCFRCLIRSFKTQNKCQSCIKNCLSCQNQQSCSQCDNGFSFNEVTKTCESDVIGPQNCDSNQLFVNETCVCDDLSINLNDGRCFTCLVGTFKNSQFTCAPCMNNCLQCSSFEDCSNCKEKYVFNPITKSCDNSSVSTQTPFVNCSSAKNQTLNRLANDCDCLLTFVRVEGVCRCPDNYILNVRDKNCVSGGTDSTNNQNENGCRVDEVFDGQKCLFCRNGTYPNSISQKCSFCIDRCTYCTDGINCLRCQLNYFYNSQNLKCELITCSDDEVFFDNRCQKNCPDGKFKKDKACTQCPQNCNKCSDELSCSQCMTKTSFSPEDKKCVQIKCGDNKLMDGEECDDGNEHDGDGCSSQCQTEPGFTCTNGTCIYEIKLDDVKIKSNGIITVLEAPEQLTEEELKQKFKIEVEGPKPKSTRIVQPEGDKKKIKVFQQYCLLPPQSVENRYSIRKNENITGTLTLQNDLINKISKIINPD